MVMAHPEPPDDDGPNRFLPAPIPTDQPTDDPDSRPQMRSDRSEQPDTIVPNYAGIIVPLVDTIVPNGDF